MRIQSPDRGFTLIEVMVSLVIFSVMITGVIAVFSAHARTNNENEVRMGAMAVTQQVLDGLRQNQNPEDLPKTGSAAAVEYVVDNKAYEAVVHYCRNASYCDSLYKRHITVEVAFDGRTISTVQTVFTRLK